MAIETLPWMGADGDEATFANTFYDGVAVSGGSIIFDDAWLPRGALALDVNGVSTKTGYLNGYHDIPASNTLAYDQPVKPVTLPPSETAMLFFGAGETRQFSVSVLSNGTVLVRNRAAEAVWTSDAGVMAPGVAVVLSVFFTRSSTTGTFRVAVFNENGTTVRMGADTGLMTGQNTGDAAITRIKSSMAKSASSSALTARHLFGRPRWDRAATGLMPTWSPHNPFRVWSSGAYAEAVLMRWTASGYKPII